MLRRRTFATGLASTLLLAACRRSSVATSTPAPPVSAQPLATPTRVSNPALSPPLAGSPISATPSATAQPSKLIYGAESAIWQLDLRTGVEKRLTPSPNRVGTPALSPDGQRLAYTAMAWPKEPNAESIGQQLWFHTLAGDRVEMALDDAPPATHRGAVAWTPDGQGLLYEFNEASARRLSIRALDLATEQSRLLIDGASQPSFSQAGRLAYLTHDNRLRSALWIADRDGRDARQVVPHSANYSMYSPRLSPDGRQVVFSSPHPENTSSRHELWIAMADGSGVRALGVSSSDEIGLYDLQCNWYPDGQQVIFASHQGIFRLPLSGAQSWSRLAAASNATGLLLTA